MFKPMKRRDYERWIASFGWKLVKSKNDWRLINQQGQSELLFIKITHPGGEIPALFVKKTQMALEKAGLLQED